MRLTETWSKRYSFFFLSATGIVSGQYPLEESKGPLSQMNEAVNNIDRPKNIEDLSNSQMAPMNKVKLTELACIS